MIWFFAEYFISIAFIIIEHHLLEPKDRVKHLKMELFVYI